MPGRRRPIADTPTRRSAIRGVRSWKGAAVERVPATGFGRASKTREGDRLRRRSSSTPRSVPLQRPASRRRGRPLDTADPWALAVLVARLRGARSAYWAMDVYPDVAFALGVLPRSSIAGRLLSASRAGPCARPTASSRSATRWRRCSVARERAASSSCTTGPTTRPFVRSVRRRAPSGRARMGRSLRRRLLGKHGPRARVRDRARGRRPPSRPARHDRVRRRRPAPQGGRAGGRARGGCRTWSSIPPFPGRCSATSSLRPTSTSSPSAPACRASLVPSKIYGILAAGVPTVYVGPRGGRGLRDRHARPLRGRDRARRRGGARGSDSRLRRGPRAEQAGGSRRAHAARVGVSQGAPDGGARRGARFARGLA